MYTYNSPSYIGPNRPLSSNHVNVEISSQKSSGTSEKDASWKSLLYDYSQETTIHGIRYLFMATPYVTRRFAS